MLKFATRLLSYSRYKNMSSKAAMLNKLGSILATENQFSHINPDQLVQVLMQSQHANIPHKNISLNIANHIIPCLNQYSLKQAIQVYTYVTTHTDPTTEFQQEFESHIAEKLENIQEIGEALDQYCNSQYVPHKILSILNAQLKLLLEQKNTSKLDALYILRPVALIKHGSTELASRAAEIIGKHIHEFEDKVLVISLPYALQLQKNHSLKIEWSEVLGLSKETLIKLYPIIEANSKDCDDLYWRFMKVLGEQALSDEEAAVIKGLCKNLDKLPEISAKLEKIGPYKYASLPLKEVLSQYVLESYNKLGEDSRNVIVHKIMECSILMTVSDIIYVLENKSPLILEEGIIDKMGNRIIELAASMNSYEYTLIVNKLKDSNIINEKFWEQFILAAANINIAKFHEIILLRSAFIYLQIKLKYNIFDRALASIHNTFYNIMQK